MEDNLETVLDFKLQLIHEDSTGKDYAPESSESKKSKGQEYQLTMADVSNNMLSR